MNVERVVIIDGRKDFPEAGQVMADVLVNEIPARCVVVFTDHGAEYIQQDWPIGWLPNVWWAIYRVMGRINRGEAIEFPLDVTAEAAEGPW